MRRRLHRRRVRAAADCGRPARRDFFQSLSLASALNPHAAGGTGRNVIAALDGTDPVLKREWIVIGAHYDHLGEGGSRIARARRARDSQRRRRQRLGRLRRCCVRPSGSPPAATGAKRAVHRVHRRGIGTAGLGAFRRAPDASRRGAMVGMINLDMVGRLGAGPLIVYGVDTADEWRRSRAGAPRAGCHDRHPRRRIRAERPHVLLSEGRAGAALLHEHARRLSQADRRLGEDRRPRPGDGGADRRDVAAAIAQPPARR